MNEIDINSTISEIRESLSQLSDKELIELEIACNRRSKDIDLEQVKHDRRIVRQIAREIFQRQQKAWQSVQA